MIVKDLLTLMSTLDNEVDVTAGGSDEVASINALNAALMYIQTVAASIPKVLSSRGDETIKTAANVESSPFPLSLQRLDRLWMLDSTTLLPIYALEPIQEVGGHATSATWLSNVTTLSSPGRPTGYYGDSDAIYFDPRPDVVYQIRAYGLWSRALFVDRNSAFRFPDSLAFSFAAFASRYATLSLDDNVSDAQALAVEVFTPALRSLRRRDRSGPSARFYTYGHTT